MSPDSTDVAADPEAIEALADYIEEQKLTGDPSDLDDGDLLVAYCRTSILHGVTLAFERLQIEAEELGDPELIDAVDDVTRRVAGLEPDTEWVEKRVQNELVSRLAERHVLAQEVE